MSGDELDYYWADISQVFNLSAEFRIQCPQYNVKSTILSQETLNFLRDNPEVNDFVEEFILDTYNIKLREEIVPEFWQSFSVDKDVDQKTAFDRFERAVTQLHARLRYVTQHTSKTIFGLTDLHEVFKLQLKGSLHSQLPGNYLTLIKKFYSQAFVVYYAKSTRRYTGDDTDDDLACEGCTFSTDLCICSAILDSFKKVNGMLSELGLLRRLTQQAVFEILKERIYWHVQESCKGSFEESYISKLVNWLDDSVLGWIRSMYGCSVPGPPLHSTPFSKPKESQEIVDYRDKLTNIMFETYTKARIEQLYNIIIEFPDSQPALEDLRDCLSRTNLRNFLTSNLRQTLDTKLLHPGVQTGDILSAYIAAIQALRVLDGSGVILELVCTNLRKYLKTREDTVKCIVQSLLDESGPELREELMKGEGLQLEDVEDEEVGDNWEEWEPDPVDADPNKIFVNEYRSLLSNRLLTHWSYDTEKEIRYLEMLKLRFGGSGEDSVYQCEVMLKDIGDSKRINYQLHSQDGGCPELITQPIRVNAMILSAHFWPPFKNNEPVQLVDQVKEALDVYTKAFQTLKGNRTLEWNTGLGFVQINVELGDKKLDLKVSPIHASIICKFQEKEEWSVNDLSASLKVSASLLKRKMAYWISQRVVKEVRRDVFGLADDDSLANDNRGTGGNNQSQAYDSNQTGNEGDGLNLSSDDESLTETRESQREEELSLFWSFIVNMLTNLDAMPIERIHQMLKIFAMQGPSAVECDINELRQFLDKKVRQQKLSFSDGQYRLPK